MITYQAEENLSVQAFKEILEKSTLGQRRPIDDPDRLAAMLAHANLVITARDNGQLIGVARSLSDFGFCTYLSDLAVDSAYQKQGIGRELIRHTKLAAPLAKIILIAAPKAVDYYPKIGMQHHEHCFVLTEVEELR
jgi:predicted N-acetyltransferase YhbS